MRSLSPDNLLTRSNILFSSISYNLIGRALTLAAPLIILPHMLEQLGGKAFAIWITGVSLTSLAAFLDFGIGNSLLTRLSASYGNNDTISARRAIAASLRIVAIISFFILFLLTIFGVSINFLGGLDAFNIDADSIIAALVLFFFIINMPIVLIQRVLLAHQQILLFNLMLVLQVFLCVVLALIGIYFDLESWVIVSLYSGFPVIFWLIVNIWYFWVFPQYRPSFSEVISGDENADIMKLGLSHFFLAILGAAGLNLDISIILSTLGAESVSEFALPARIGFFFYTIVATAYIPLWALFGSAISKGEYVWVLRISTYLSFFGALIILAAGVFTWLKIDQIMMAWTARSFNDQELVVLGFVCMSVMIALTSPWNMVLNAAGVVRIQIIAWSCFVFVSIVAKIFLVASFGAWIVGFISAASYLIFIFFPVFFVARRMLLDFINNGSIK